MVNVLSEVAGAAAGVDVVADSVTTNGTSPAARRPRTSQEER
jgi:hypothetical protein